MDQSLMWFWYDAWFSVIVVFSTWTFSPLPSKRKGWRDKGEASLYEHENQTAYGDDADSDA